MFKKIIVLMSSLVLMSCQENSKDSLQELINAKDFVAAKTLAEAKLGQFPQDDYYNGAMGYILSVNCIKSNCPVSEPEDLKKIRYYLQKSRGLAKVSDGYFIDFYQDIMSNVITAAVQQKNIKDARLVLKEFVNNSNPRLAFIYKDLYSRVITDLLNENVKNSALDLELLKEFNFELSEEELASIDLLLAFENSLSLADLKDKIRAFNRDFVDKKLPNEFLIALAPAIVEYSLKNNMGSVVDILEQSVKERGTIFGENIFVLLKDDNVEAYAKGIELISRSDNIIKTLEKTYMKDNAYFVNNLQNISLKLNAKNENLWSSYLESLLKSESIKSLYKNIDIDSIPSKVIVSNNNRILEYSEKLINEKSITNILNEIVFRDDSNKEFYTNKTIEIVEKALKVEIAKNNLDGIFEYLNYVPSLKSKFKVELSKSLNSYIDIAWNGNSFDNLKKVIDLHRDLNEVKDDSILIDLFEAYLLKKDVQEFFKAETISDLITQNSNEELRADLESKYAFVLASLRKEEIQNSLFSTARKMDGLYTQAKLFSFFMNVFSKDKVDDLIIDSVSTALAKDSSDNLQDIVGLANFLIEKANKLPKSYIEKEIMPLFGSVDDVQQTWAISTSKTKDLLVEYNPDIKNLIKVIENNKLNKKILTAKYIGKIKSKAILPFIEKYKVAYQSYINGIQGYYVASGSDELGPEIIRVMPTGDLLKVKIDFISRLGKIENLDRYKLDRGEVINKEFTSYYDPALNSITLEGNYTSKEQSIFVKSKNILFNEDSLMLKDVKYKKVNNLFVFNKKYGVVEQITETTQDNFHILPEGASFELIEELSNNLYMLKLRHPALKEPISVKALYNPLTAEFSFEYDYFIKLFDKTFSAKAKCQLIDEKAYCAVQDKYWKRQEYSVIIKALQVK
jgi:hypothetical protein